MIRQPPRSTQSRSSAASDVYKRQVDLSHEISPQQLFPGDPGIQILSQGIFSYVAGLLFSFGNTASVFSGAYIIYSSVHKILGYCYKVLVLREAHGWTKDILFCCCSDFLQMRKYRADYRTARMNESLYEDPRHLRRPPSEGADASDSSRLLGEPESILKKEKNPPKYDHERWSRLEQMDTDLRNHYQRPGVSQSTYFSNASCPSEHLYSYPRSRSTLPRVSVTAPTTPTPDRVVQSPNPGGLSRNVSFAALPVTTESTLSSVTTALPTAMAPLYPSLSKKTDQTQV